MPRRTGWHWMRIASRSSWWRPWSMQRWALMSIIRGSGAVAGEGRQKASKGNRTPFHLAHLLPSHPPSPILAPLNFFRNMSIENKDRPEPADSISAPNSSAESRSAPMQPMPLLFYSEGNLLSRQASASLSACKTKLSPQHALALSILLLANLCPNPVKTHDVDPIFLYDHPTRTPTM